MPAAVEVYVIDKSVDQWQQIASDLAKTAPDGTKFVYLERDSGGSEQLASALSGLSGISSIHIFSHGADGQVVLGNTTLDSATLSQHADAWKAIGAAMTAEGDILLYGCDVSQSSTVFIDRLAGITGADVAASSDATGSAIHGGNWTLESRSGSIETAAVADEAYAGLLAAPTVNTSTTEITVIEPTTLNDVSTTRATLSGWTLSDDGVGSSTVRVDATVSNTGVGTLSDPSANGSAITIAGGLRYTGSVGGAQAWLNQLVFTASNAELGSSAAHAQITVSITDGESTPLTASRVIDVTVTAANDPATLNDGVATVVEGSNVAITGTALAPVDSEVTFGSQNTTQLVYRLTQDTSYGYLTLNGDRLGVGSTFTQAQVESGSVRYVHTAGGTAQQNTADEFRVSLNDGATPQANSATAKVTINVTPVNQAPTVSGGGDIFEGQPANATSAGVPQSIVGNFITADGGGDPGDPTLNVKLTGLTAHGSLFFTGSAVVNGVTTVFTNHLMTSADLAGSGFVFAYSARGGLRYSNDGIDVAGLPPSDSFNVTVTDGGGGLGAGAALSASTTIALNIRPVNDDPTLNPASTLTATVTGNGPDATPATADDFRVTITTGMLQVTDVDSGNERISFVLTDIPVHGYVLVNNEIIGLGSTFNMADVVAGRVQYIQLDPAGVGATDLFKFKVQDNALSVKWDGAGEDFTRTGGIYDNAAETSPLTEFTFTLNLQASASGGDGTGLTPRAPAPAPTTSLTTSYAGTDPNTGTPVSTVTEGGTTVIYGDDGVHSPMLFYAATGVPSSQVIYTIEGFTGTTGAWNGVIQRFNTTTSTWVNLSQYDTFSQADLDAGRVQFVHDGNEDFESGVRLQVSAGGIDNGAPLVTDIEFKFYVKPVNDAPVTNGSTNNLMLEGGTTAITTAQLSFSDADDATSESYLENTATLPGGLGNNFALNNGALGGTPLQFFITSLPTHGKLQWNNGGTWTDVLVSDLNTTLFNTSLITGSAGTTGLRYVHDGSEARTDTFGAVSRDRWNADSNSGSVSFVVTNVNDPPQIASDPTQPDPTGTDPNNIGGASANQPLVGVLEGTVMQITNAYLQAYDPDSTSQQVQYRITQAPAHGYIAYSDNGTTFQLIGLGFSFTQEQVANGKIYYVNDGSDPTSTGYPATPDDLFKFTLADGDKEQVNNSFWIYVTPTNDAPVVAGPTGPINIDSAIPGNNPVAGFSVSDPDLATVELQESDFMQVTVRLLNSANTPFNLANYGGTTIQVATTGAASGISIDGTHGGSDDYLTIRGTSAQVNAALAGLTVTFATDRNAIYKVEVVADDRVRDASTGAFLDRDSGTGGTQPGGNGGGTLNSPPTGSITPSTVVNSELNFYTDAANSIAAIAGNVSAKSVVIRASSVNDPATLTGPSTATTFEDQPTFIGGSFVVSDPESAAFDTPVTVTLSVPQGTLGIGGSGAQTTITPPAGQAVGITGDNTGTVTLTGRASDIEALLNSSTLGLTYTSAANANHDQNSGGTAGDVTLTTTFSDGASNIGNDGGSGSVSNNPAPLITAITITAVNDAPTVTAGTGSVSIVGTTSIGGFVIADTDNTDGGPLASTAGETDFVQVTIRLTDTSNVPLSALQHLNVVLSSTSSPAEDGTSFEIDNTYSGNASALVIRGTVANVNSYLAGLQLSLSGALLNGDTTYRIQVVADDRVRNVATGVLTASANGGDNPSGAGVGSGTTAPPGDVAGSIVDPYATAPTSGEVLKNTGIGFRAIFPSGVNDPGVISAANVTVNEGSGTITFNASNGNFSIADPDAQSASNMTATVTVPAGFVFTTVGGAGGSVVGLTTSTITITGTQAQINSRLQAMTVSLPDEAASGLNDPTAADWNGTFNVTVVYNDMGNTGGRPGTIPGDTNAPGSNPGDYSYADGSSAALVTTRTISVTVNAVNDAPQRNGAAAVTLPAVNEDTGSTPTGDTIANLFAGKFKDPLDPITNGSSANAFYGVAVVGYTPNAAQGVWQYQVDGTGAWVDIGARTLGTALVLDSNDKVRFVAAGDFHGTPDGLTARLVEDGGSPPVGGTQVDLSGGSATGGSSRYSDSSNAVTLGTTVTSVNDRPTLATSTLASTVEDTAAPAGATVATIFGGTYSDATDNQTAITGGGNSATALGGIAITGNASTSAEGKWQYNTSGTWIDLPTGLSDASALVLRTTDQLRFVPAGDYNGTPGALTVRAADTTQTFATGVDIGTAAASATGTWSIATTLTTAVAARNDAPVLTGAATNPSVTENNLTGASVSISPVKLLTGTTTIADLDLATTTGLSSTVFGAGSITVSFTDAYRTGDVLFVDLASLTGGVLPTGVSTSGGSAGALTITLASGTTLAQVQEMLRAISYQSTSDDPTPGGDTDRHYSIVVNDGNNVQAGGNAGGAAALNSNVIDGIITITAVNDPPTAVDDVNSINENDISVAGDLTRGTPGQDSDPDSATLTVTTIRTGTEAAGTGTSGTVGSPLGGSYGSITISANGSYTYTLDNNNPTVNALIAGQSLTETFTYTISDGNGGTDTAQVTITIHGVTDTAPAISAIDNNGGLTGQSTVSEAGLGNLGNTSESTTGIVVVQAPDGLDHITINGTNVTAAQLAALGGTPVSIATVKGTLQLTNFNGGTGELSYTYTLGTAQTHPATGDVTDVFTLSVTDVTPQVSSGTLTILIQDDVPTANNDSADVTENTAGVVSANLLTGAGADRIGADANSNPVTAVSVGGVAHTVGTSFATAYGSIVVNSNGTYTYTLDNNNATVQHLIGGETLADTISYVITDGDGDTSTANLVVTIHGANDPVSITVTDSNGGATGQATVSEQGINDPSDSSETTTGTFTLSAPDGLDHITVGGTTVTNAQLLASSTTPLTFTTAKGVLTINGYDATSGLVNYSYTQTTAQINGATDVTDVFTIGVEDRNGDTSSGTLTVLLLDAQPIANNDTGTITVGGANASIAGNVIGGSGNPGDVADRLGGDAIANPVTGVSFGGVSGTIGGPLAGAYGSLVLNANGSYSYAVNIRDPRVSALSDGKSLTETYTYSIVDADGDTATATLTIVIRGSTDNVKMGDQIFPTIYESDLGQIDQGYTPALFVQLAVRASASDIGALGGELADGEGSADGSEIKSETISQTLSQGADNAQYVSRQGVAFSVGLLADTQSRTRGAGNSMITGASTLFNDFSPFAAQEFGAGGVDDTSTAADQAPPPPAAPNAPSASLDAGQDEVEAVALAEKAIEQARDAAGRPAIAAVGNAGGSAVRARPSGAASFSERLEAIAARQKSAGAPLTDIQRAIPVASAKV